MRTEICLKGVTGTESRLGSTLMAWFCDIRARKFGVAFQADKLTGLDSASIPHLINHTAMSAGSHELDARFRNLCGEYGGGMHGGHLLRDR